MRVHLGTVSHFSLAVTDVRRSADWWLSHFDLTEVRSTERFVALGNDAILIVLFAGRPDATVLSHLAFNAGDLKTLENARDVLRERGVALEDPGNEIGPVSPGSTSVGLWFADLDGYRWELYVVEAGHANEG